jgi:O-antigen/teichoic acid export membrane protein
VAGANQERRFDGRFTLRGRSLRQHAARGTMVNSAFLVLLALLGFGKGFVLAGLLSPEDYGVWGIIVLALGTLVWLKDVGIGDKFIQQDEEDQAAALQQAFTLELIFSGGFTVLLMALTPLVALLYDEPRVIAPALVTLLAMPAAAFQAPLWAFYRRMDFARQRAIQAVNPIVGIVVSVVLAVAGAGVWALVGGFVAGAWAQALLAAWASPHPLGLRLARGTVRSYADFSWPLIVAGGASLVIAQASIFCGTDATGLIGAGAIALSATVTQLTNQVNSIVTGTLYPAICAVKDRTDLLYESFVKSNRIALMWAVPFGLGLTLFAADLVHFGIGDKWEPAIGLLQLMGATAAIAHLGFNWDAYFRARAETKPLAVASVAAMVTFLAVGVPLTYAEGLIGFGLGLLAQGLAHLAVRWFYLRRLFAGAALVPHALRAFGPLVPGVAVVGLARLVEGGGERTAAMAAGELVLYVAITVVATLTLERRLLREALAYLRPSPAPAV